MTATTTPGLFHVFLAEDEEGLNKDLKALIEIRIPGSVVTSVLSVNEAFQKLETAALPPIDIALLDVLLPETTNAVVRTQQPLNDRMKKLGVPSILMSGFIGTHEDVDKFIQDRKLSDPPLKVISKRQMDVFVDLVIDTIREFFVWKASNALHKQLGEVFGVGGSSNGYRSSTAELMSLQRQIINYWHYLSPKVRDEVRCRFSVTEDSDGCCSLSMIPAVPR